MLGTLGPVCGGPWLVVVWCGARPELCEVARIATREILKIKKKVRSTVCGGRVSLISGSVMGEQENYSGTVVE
jgi:hypothetical protein